MTRVNRHIFVILVAAIIYSLAAFLTPSEGSTRDTDSSAPGGCDPAAVARAQGEYKNALSRCHSWCLGLEGGSTKKSKRQTPAAGSSATSTDTESTSLNCNYDPDHPDPSDVGPDFYSAVLQRCQENYDSHGGSDCGPLPLDDKEDGKIDDNGDSEKQYALDEKRSQKCKMADSTILAQRLHDTTQTMTDAKEKAFKAQEKLMEAAATETDNENKLVQQLTSIQPKVTNDLQNLRDQLSAKQIEARRTINSALAEINSADKDIDAIERQGAALREKFLKDLANLKLACEQGTMDNAPKGGYPMMSVNQLTNAQSVGGLRVYKCMRDIKNRRGPEANLEFEYQSKMNELIRKEDEARTKIASLNNSIHIDDGALTDLQKSTLSRIDQETQAAATQTQALNTQLRQMQANSQKSMASLQSSYAADQKLFDDASSDYEFSRNGYQQLASKGILGETPNNDSSKDGSAPPMGVVINQGFEGASLMKKDPYEGCSGIASAGTSSNSKSVAVTVGRQPAANTGSPPSSNSNPPSSTTGGCADGTSNCTPQNATH